MRNIYKKKIQAFTLIREREKTINLIPIISITIPKNVNIEI